MATLGTPGHAVDWYRSSQSTATALLRGAYHYHPRTRLAKAVLITVAFCLLLIVFSPRSTDVPINYWTTFPTYISKERPENSRVLSEAPVLDKNGTLPPSLQKTTPQFHLILPVRKASPAVCRTLTSAMMLNYPPPTLIGYGKQLPADAKEKDEMMDRVVAIKEYLNQTESLKDQDFVLLLDDLDVFFQLPPQVVIRRFQNVLRENNMKLLKKYGLAILENPSNKDGAPPEIVQKYLQRVLFASSKQCLPNMPNDAGCITVPQSSLPPDAYGWKTDTHPSGNLNRPRWLTPGAVMGQVADLKLIYAEITRFIDQHRVLYSDYAAITQMYGRQEYVRELERRRTSSGFKEWLYRRIGLSDASNITDMFLHLEAGRRYEYGIGVDYESQVFFNMRKSHNDMDWFRYTNVSKASVAQQQHGVPRERRLLLPVDLTAENLASPFIQRNLTKKDEMTNPPYNKTLDFLPEPKNISWHNLPLMTNVRSPSVPALLHVDGDRLDQEGLWKKMWFQPWARALLRKYMRSNHGLDVAKSALRGGQDWFDMRGGKGGVWTGKGEWIEYVDVCGGYERDIFDDGYGPWGKEAGDEPDEPVYNQFGSLIKGHE